MGLVYRSPILDKERGWRRMLQVEQIYVAKWGCVFVVVVKILTKALGDVIIVKSSLMNPWPYVRSHLTQMIP